MSHESYLLGCAVLGDRKPRVSALPGYDILGNSFHRTEIVGKGHMPARIRGYEAEIFGEEIGSSFNYTDILGNSFNNTEILGDDVLGNSFHRTEIVGEDVLGNSFHRTEIVGDAAWQAAIFGDEAEIFGWQAEIFGGGDYRDASTVTAVQKELRNRGYKNKKGQPLDVDGVYGPDTAAAVKNVQLQTGGAQSGAIDDSLLLTLGLPLPTQQARPVIPAIPNIPNMPAIPNIPGLTIQPDPLAQMLPPGERKSGGEPSFLDKPISEGSNVKVYQAGLGVIGLGLLTAGLYAAMRR